MTETQVFMRTCQVIENYRLEKQIKALPKGFLESLVASDKKALLNDFELDEFDQSMAARLLSKAQLNESKLDLFLAELEAKFEVSQETGGVIKSTGLVAWNVNDQLADSHYWKSLERFWSRESPMSDEVIRAIHKDTNDILSWCGNPSDAFDWQRTGLVMGHVQSGKTTNFSALANKAFDVGYNHVVVLAGLTNSLRRQTQERLDETVLGRSSEGDSLNRLELGVSMYRDLKIDKSDIIALTRESKDFNQLANEQLDIVEGKGIKILWVVKKNVNVLKSLVKFMSTKLSRNGSKLDLPLLIIDDEADNASVDTKYGGDKPSAINEQIRMLLNCARRYSYVGYTATPFANIFIDPEKSESEVLADELFPRDFIKSLEPADNYIGPHKIFNVEHELYDKCVISLNELEKTPPYRSSSVYKDHIPDSHKSSLKVQQLPDSLRDSILLFIAFCAYRIKSDTDNKHTSMLINVSLYNAVQLQVYELVSSLLKDLRSDLVTLGATKRWASSNLISRMETIYELQNMERELGVGFTDILPACEPALSRVEQFLVNMSKESKELKYPKGEPQGKFVLAIGGLALSRGLTLEGLVVSYIIRNVGAKDTLLQTARWFGYRDGYADACRVFMPSKLEQRFLETAMTVQELRDDLKRMVDLRKTPQEFGLRVRHSGLGLSVTAPTKMGTGEKIVHAADYAARHIQYASVSLRDEEQQQNKQCLRTLVAECKDWRIETEALVSGSQSIDTVLSFLGSYSQNHADFSMISADDQGKTANLLCSYIMERRSELAEWDIVIPFSRTPTSNKGIALPADQALEELCLNEALTQQEVCEVSKLFLRQRLSGEHLKDGLYAITKNGAVADQVKRDAGFSQSEELRSQFIKLKNFEIFPLLQRPILLIHCVQAGVTAKEQATELVTENPIFTISLCFPGTAIEPSPRTYIANPIFRDQLRKAQKIELEIEDVVENE